ncbi:TetR/AcrR family transcriptional regulator [Streptomyces sp. LHD-70]|uniref:TetR/AcrR family transcriptional regulator n=1 Tax=Streptomyces sp. LHD-70 TaxID=3072140 RepID=UPI0028103279|nr:TetR/AcrR family transcriptional regulator [Streptomyces sp. LHD-70]MDQ8701068.1 TetR/AcrR family transcriptional regulator [Streptomyces sp. LHD-70]
MTKQTAPKGRPRGGQLEKRRAILAGALAVFARDGYTRASIDAISTEAGVSTRTIYNHFQDKAELFRTVIQESSTQVAEAQIDLIDRHLGKVTDLEADLIAFGRAWLHPADLHTQHAALVRQINAEGGHLPQSAVDAWQQAGPLRVRRALAARLAELAEHGLLTITEPEQAALHFSVLMSASTPSRPAGPAATEKETAEAVAAGVRAFLYGHLPREAL